MIKDPPMEDLIGLELESLRDIHWESHLIQMVGLR